MTNERAIELLQRISDSQFDGIHGDERREALEMAVRALSSQQTDTDSQGLVNDCISRQAAIIVFENSGLDDDSKDTAVRVLEQLPSAQPTQTNAHPTQFNALDCVSREEVLDAIDKYILRKPEGCVEVKELLKLITKVYHMPIYRIPSAHPQRKKGKWIDGKGNVKIVGYGAYCSCCKRESEYVTNYCPSCGADMRGESECS